MARSRAGHGWTGFFRGKKFIPLICDSHGRWVTTGIAKDWPRCKRCRKPEDMMPEESGLCTTCFYYKNDKGADWFWGRKNDYLFPYNTGSRLTASEWDRRPLSDLKVNWREYLKTQPNYGH